MHFKWKRESTEEGREAPVELMLSLEDHDSDFNDGDVVTLGNTSVLCRHTPGHTEGTYSFFFEVTEDGKTYVSVKRETLEDLIERDIWK